MKFAIKKSKSATPEPKASEIVRRFVIKPKVKPTMFPDDLPQLVYPHGLVPTMVMAMRHCPEDWMTSRHYVYCGRSGKGLVGIFGNPFGGEACGLSVERSIQAYQEYAFEKWESDKQFRDAVIGLHGKILVCFCAPKQGVFANDRPIICHACILAFLSDRAAIEAHDKL